MADWSVIHIFAYNQTQISGVVDNGFVENTLIASSLSAVYSALAAIAPLGTTISIADSYVLTINESYLVDFMPNDNTPGNKQATIDWTALDATSLAAIAALATDIETYI